MKEELTQEEVSEAQRASKVDIVKALKEKCFCGSLNLKQQHSLRSFKEQLYWVVTLECAQGHTKKLVYIFDR